MAVFDPILPEVWYPIPQIPGYEISSHLRVRSVRTHPRYRAKATSPRLIKIQLDDRGYRKIVVHGRDKRCQNFYLHHIIAEFAHGPCPVGQVVRHLDDDKSNNWPSNLAYGTRSDNMSDAKRNNRLNPARGERQRKARLTELQVRAGRQLDRMNVSRKLIAFALGISPKNIASILDGKQWAHVEDASDLVADGREHRTMPV